MIWHDKFPISLKKEAADIIPFPGENVAAHPDRGSDLIIASNTALDNLATVIVAMEEELEPGELNEFYKNVEDIITNFVASIIDLKERHGKRYVFFGSEEENLNKD